MKITFILKNKTDDFFQGWKYGIGSFRDKVELNQIRRSIKSLTYKLEPRRGYKLATFEVQ